MAYFIPPNSLPVMTDNITSYPTQTTYLKFKKTSKTQTLMGEGMYKMWRVKSFIWTPATWMQPTFHWLIHSSTIFYTILTFARRHIPTARAFMTSYFYYNRREVSILLHPTRHYPNFTTSVASPYYYTPAIVLFYHTRHKVPILPHPS